MRIGIDISQLAYPGTGVATYTQNLVESLLRIDKENEYVFFFSSLRGKHPTNDWKLKSFKFPPIFFEFLWNRLHVLAIETFTGKIDVFHTSDWLEPPAKCPKVTTIHDLVVYKYPQTLHPRIVANQKRKLEWVKKESRLVIAVSESTKRDMMEILRIPEEKIRVVYEACDTEFTEKSKENTEKVKQKYGIGGKYILAVGTREPRKNLKRVIEAFEKVQSPKSKVQSLVIVGKFGWGLALDRDRVRDRVKILGYVPKEDLAALYTGAQVFVYPSLYEGFGLPILEAMNCGCPVVTSHVSSLPEVAGEAAILVNPENVEEIAEGIKKAMKNRTELIKKGFARAKEFSWQKTARETLEVYKEAVS